MKRLAASAVLALTCLVTPVSSATASVPGLTFTETSCEGYSDSVARLYSAGLGREPEAGGFGFWLGQYTSGGYNLQAMANFFVASTEFDSKYGKLEQDGFLNQIYLNVLDRPADDEGLVYWGTRMSAGMTRGQVLLSFVESPENVTRSGTSEPILGPYNVGLQGAWSCETGELFVAGNPGNTYNCSDFETHAGAQEWFDYYFPKYGDVANLDSNDDGLACESLP